MSYYDPSDDEQAVGDLHDGQIMDENSVPPPRARACSASLTADTRPVPARIPSSSLCSGNAHLAPPTHMARPASNVHARTAPTPMPSHLQQPVRAAAHTHTPPNARTCTVPRARQHRTTRPAAAVETAGQPFTRASPLPNRAVEPSWKVAGRTATNCPFPHPRTHSCPYRIAPHRKSWYHATLGYRVITPTPLPPAWKAGDESLSLLVWTLAGGVDAGEDIGTRPGYCVEHVLKYLARLFLYLN
ncbi:hypothetical protein FIBSPDRAFT_939798 [Athelia psychrophila]|uniref:Uncharacterized protein n=1 Tax=Athelia psychrophila TaxID=1759441 RepID=A0A167X6Q6_9AGAM|nr:hypothetical protein FIBSPDRAFT_939798 [Fibularhizoctonia sp. CBS 109695]